MSKTEAFYERQYQFALNCQRLASLLTPSSSNKIYSNQLIRSSSSIGANYIEALGGLSRKDFSHRLKICRKEARETIHWLRLINDTNHSNKNLNEITVLINEATEFTRILTSTIITLEKMENDK